MSLCNLKLKKVQLSTHVDLTGGQNWPCISAGTPNLAKTKKLAHNFKVF